MRYSKAQPAPFLRLFGAQPGREFCQADVSARAVGESISLDGTAAFSFSVHLLLVVFGTSGRVGKVGPCQRHPTMRGRRWAGPAHGVSGPQHACVGSLYVYVRIMYNKMGVEAESLACLGRCTYNTGKAVVQDVVTKQSKATECHIVGWARLAAEED